MHKRLKISTNWYNLSCGGSVAALSQPQQRIEVREHPARTGGKTNAGLARVAEVSLKN